MFSLEKMNINIILLLFLIIFFLVLYALYKLRTILILKNKITELNQIIERLDHQAGLIMKSDVEAKLYQEEVEDKLRKLALLKNLIIFSINILDKEQLLSQINEKIINELGFRRCLILTFDNLSIKNFGFNQTEIEIIKNFIYTHKVIFKTSILLSEETELYKEISLNLQTKFLLGTIGWSENIYGVFLVSDYYLAGKIDLADKQIFTIICMYLGQCLENIRLFEEIYKTKEGLEIKIKERTQELVKSLREIEKISKIKSDFISTLSHELRTPLTSIKGFSSLLIDEKFGKLPQDARERLKKIDENVDKLVEMVNVLLDISRIESGKFEIKIAPSDVVSLIKDVSDFLLPQARLKNIQFTLEVPPELIVYMDRNLIERVLINLLNNAIKFTPQGGSIKIICKKEATYAMIGVSDTGCGIEKENIDKIFEEFYRVDNQINREIKGSGLGLSLVKRIIDTHREKIWVDSKIGEGSTFYFTLKLK